AVMTFLGTATAVMRPTALVLNLMVATLGARAFIGAGHFRWALTWPFLLTSVPMAYLGGRMSLDVETYRTVVGVVLLLSAVRLVFQLRAHDTAGTIPHRGI